MQSIVHWANDMERARIAIDVEGGDFGAQVIIRGTIDALRICESPFKAFLCGDQAQIEQLLLREPVSEARVRDNINIVHCSQSVSAHEGRRSRVWKNRKDASIIRCISLQREGRVDASVSAGDTAILMGAALFIIGRRKGEARPALAAILPTIKKQPVLLLDVGANLNCRKEHLVSFAFMGKEYYSLMFDKVAPSVALLNIGKEPAKGTPVIGETGKILRKRCSTYAGFIEGNRVLSGDADVIVCDGFAGNVLLKTYESFHVLLESVLDQKPVLLAELRQQMAVFNPENYGAVPFLGIKGIVLKAHGSSSPRAIASAVLAAEHAVRRNAIKNVFA
jgi:phosphate acyltransferase